MSDWLCYHGEQAQREPRLVPAGEACTDCGYKPPCDHIWVHYNAGEDASATLSAPDGTATFSEPVFVCSLCALIQPEEWVEKATGAGIVEK